MKEKRRRCKEKMMCQGKGKTGMRENRGMEGRKEEIKVVSNGTCYIFVVSY